MNYSTSTRMQPMQAPMNVFKTGGSLSQRLRASMSWTNILIILGVILLIYVGYVVYSQYATNKTAFTANRENVPIDQNSNHTATLMLFYVDWCPHCKTAKPEWEALKSEYEGKSINGYTLSFVEYNCTEETAEVSQLMDKYKIEGYPTIKLIKDNQVIEYDAKPTKSTMEQFLNTVL
jgi:thiol-disulfide isomerase/thioredoxin